MGLAEPCPRQRVMAFEDVAKVVRSDGAVEPE